MKTLFKFLPMLAILATTTLHAQSLDKEAVAFV